MMCTTYGSLIFHVVFSTKNRVPTIEPDLKTDLHAYLGGTIRGLGGIPFEVGGVEDHVHLAIALKPTHCLADFVRELKKASSSWGKDRIPGFAWQEGYAIFGLDAKGIAPLKLYIETQQVHHRKIGSKAELLALCHEAGIEPEVRFFV